MNSVTIGQQAEDAVAQYLKRSGYQILARNWKTKICEIDIVAKNDGIIYFTEVKFRSGTAQGGGMDYIGPQKLRRMRFAAEVWVQQNGWEGDYRLLASAVSTDGQAYIVEEPIELSWQFGLRIRNQVFYKFFFKRQS